MGRKKTPSTAQPLLLTISDVAVQLQVCRATVYNWIYYNGLPSVKVGGARRVYPDALHAWVKQNDRCSA